MSRLRNDKGWVSYSALQQGVVDVRDIEQLRCRIQYVDGKYVVVCSPTGKVDGKFVAPAITRFAEVGDARRFVVEELNAFLRGGWAATRSASTIKPA